MIIYKGWQEIAGLFYCYDKRDIPFIFSIFVDILYAIEDDLLKEDQALDTLGLTHMNFASAPFHQSLCYRNHAYRMSLNSQLLFSVHGDQQVECVTVVKALSHRFTILPYLHQVFVSSVTRSFLCTVKGLENKTAVFLSRSTSFRYICT